MHIFIHQLSEDNMNERQNDRKFLLLKREIMNAVAKGELSSEWLKKIQRLESQDEDSESL